MSPEDQSKTELAVSLLDGLLNPSKIPVPTHKGHVSDNVGPFGDFSPCIRGSSGSDKLKGLQAMTKKLGRMFEMDQSKWQEARTELATKMTSLKKLAETLNLIPAVLNKFMLVHL